MGKSGHLPPPPAVKVFLCISSYSKTLSRRIIHALFSQPVVCFWVQCPQPHLGLHPWTLLGDFRLQTPNLLTHEKNPVGAHDWNRYQQLASDVLPSTDRPPGTVCLLHYELLHYEHQSCHRTLSHVHRRSTCSHPSGTVETFNAIPAPNMHTPTYLLTYIQSGHRLQSCFFEAPIPSTSGLQLEINMSVRLSVFIVSSLRWLSALWTLDRPYQTLVSDVSLTIMLWLTSPVVVHAEPITQGARSVGC